MGDGYPYVQVYVLSHCYISPYYCYSHCDFENKILVMNFVDKDVSEYELNYLYYN